MRISDWSSDVCSSDLSGGETDQHEADIVDRRISEQALDVLLPDRADSAENDRGERQEDDDLLPRRERRTLGAHRLDQDAHEQRHRRALDRKSTRLNSLHSCATRMPSSSGNKKSCTTNMQFKILEL